MEVGKRDGTSRKLMTSIRSRLRGSRVRNAVDKAVYSASVVLAAILG